MDQITRRDILMIGAAGIAANLGTSASAQTGQDNKPPAPAKPAATSTPAATTKPAEDFRTAFIGIGGRGSLLLRTYLRQKGPKIVAVCDTNAENLDQAKKVVLEGQGHEPDTYGKNADDFKAMLARKDVDAVVMATPCFEHARMFLAAIAAGKHIYGEKPMALTVAEADAIVAAADANPKIVVQVGFQWMSNAKMVDCVQRVHKGEIGDLIEGRFARHGGASPLLGWFGHRKQSGDWMVEQACHEFNIMNWVAKATPIRAYGLGRNDIYTNKQPDRDVTDYYSAIIEYPNGFTVHYGHGWISPKGFEGMMMRAIGTKGGVDVLEGRISLLDEKAKVDPIVADNSFDSDVAMGNFFRSIREGKPAIAPVANGRNAMLTALLVRKAVYERREVSWNEMLRTC